MKNEITFGGRVTRDLVSRKAGKATVANFSLAHNREYTVRKGNEEETRSEVIYMDCVAWNKLVDELMSENVGKGTPIEVTGYLTQDEWEDRDGKTQKRIRINVREFQVLSGSPKKVQKVSAPTEEEFESVEVAQGESAPF